MSIEDTISVSNQITLDKQKLTSYMFYVAATKLFLEKNYTSARKCLKNVDLSYLNNKQRLKTIEINLGSVGPKLRKVFKGT